MGETEAQGDDDKDSGDFGGEDVAFCDRKECNYRSLATTMR